MWPVVAEYQRRKLPEWPGTHIPHNDDVLHLLTTLYDVGWHIHPEGNWAAASAGVQAGHPSVFTGHGHALVIQRIVGDTVTGRSRYVAGGRGIPTPQAAGMAGDAYSA